MSYTNKKDKQKYNRKYFRQWYEKNGKTRNRNEDHIQKIVAWRNANPEKFRATYLLYYAVKTGRVTKPKTCQNCGRETRLVGHHHDYSKPYEVKWLCGSCHKLGHLEVAT